MYSLAILLTISFRTGQFLNGFSIAIKPSFYSSRLAWQWKYWLRFLILERWVIINCVLTSYYSFVFCFSCNSFGSSLSRLSHDARQCLRAANLNYFIWLRSIIYVFVFLLSRSMSIASFSKSKSVPDLIIISISDLMPYTINTLYLLSP